MPPEEILAATRRQPFEPFRIVLTDGTVYDIRHPEMVLTGTRAFVVGLPGDPQRPHERFVTVALLHVVRLQPLQPAGVPGDGQGA
jgi:hypothetical protein